MQKISVEKVEQKDDVAGAAASVRAEFDSRFRVRSRDMNVLAPNSRVAVYLPSLRTILQRLRATSATPSSLYTSPQLPPSLIPSPLLPDNTTSSVLASADNDEQIVGSSLNPLLPLPGAMAPVAPPTEETTPTYLQSSTPVLSSMSERGGVGGGMVECLVQQCPPSLHIGFMDLFPGVSVSNGELLVITLCEKTVNDMTVWSQVVGEEREQLMKNFIETAKEICARLSSAGLWSDFIDPYSGRAFYSPHSNNILQETDDRFRYLGFDVQDLGCCKSISHPSFGCHAFVGVVFTNAKIDSPSVLSILQL